jgi:hypothetical protein
MRLLIGTLFCGENEFDSCLASINKQSHHNYHHFVIKYLGKRDAHVALYSRFMQEAKNFDLFVKVDADMVLTNDRLFESIVDRFERRQQLQNLQIAVHDFFSERLIGALHSYRANVVWDTNLDPIFTDFCQLSSDVVEFDDSVLAPGALHCPDPHPFQSFHYGLHRGVKALVATERKMRDSLKFHATNIGRTWLHFLRTRDPRVALACVGAELALRGDLGSAHLGYFDPTAVARCDDLGKSDPEEIFSLLTQLRLENASLRARWGREIGVKTL